MLFLFVFGDNAFDAVDEAGLFVRYQTHELFASAAVEQHEDLNLTLDGWGEVHISCLQEHTIKQH